MLFSDETKGLDQHVRFCCVPTEFFPNRQDRVLRSHVAGAGKCSSVGGLPRFGGRSALRRPAKRIPEYLGGAWGPGSTQSIRLLPADAQSGRRVLCVELGQVPAAEHRYLQCFASGFGPTREYYQTRNLARYERLHFGLRNRTHAALRCAVQVKDYRDSKSQSATYRFELPAAEAAVSIEAPLALADAHWTVEGHPDLSRVLTIDFLFEPCTAIRSGQVYLSDVSLVEPGGPVDIDTSPLPVLVERLARRQWDALWSARSRSHGMIPNNSYQATDAGLNTTAAVLWMLPAATRRGWVQQADADRYVESLVHTIGGLLDRAKYLPPRNVDWTTLKPSLLPEESSVDAAFLTLALYQYKCLSSTSPPLRTAIDQTQNRFDFAAFSCPEGWRMAYRYPTPQSAEGFVRCVYDGYTNEGNLTSLAAQPRVQPSRAHRDALEHQHQAGADAIGRAPGVTPPWFISSRNSGPLSRRPCGTSSSTSGSAASTPIRTGAWP